jgi:putative spermidine/putrescine transport system ATP-binding protein
VTVAGQPLTLGRALAAPAGAAVSLALRPQAVALGRQPGNDAALEGTVADVSFLGSVVRVRVAIDGQALSFDMFNTAAIRPPAIGDAVAVSFAAADVLVTSGQ